MAHLRWGAIGVVGAALFGFSWLYRFNDPGGAFAGLTDDHFFYLVRGWQILFGDLPVRDFVDHGAPLFYYVGAAVQWAFGRGTLSEVAFCVTALSAGAVLTFLLAERACGSIVLGLAAALIQVFLQPRFYNYPKILVYATVLPLLWWFADRPGGWPRAWLAFATVIAFLFRHDHGVFVAISFAVLLTLLTDLPVRQRMRHAIVYTVLVAALVAPYLVFIQFNGGVPAYVRDAAAWAARDRNRAPVIWPALVEQPAGAATPLAFVRENIVAWMYYLEVALPPLALGLLTLSRSGYRPHWSRAVPKLATVAVLALLLDVGFLRSPLAARLADPSVPLCILLAWLGTALIQLLMNPDALLPPFQRFAWLIRAVAAVAVALFAIVAAIAIRTDVRSSLVASSLTTGIDKAFDRAEDVSRQLRVGWELSSWVKRDDRPDLVNLSLYLDACTRPTDRVFVQPYIPQVVALARRAFAGGHADLRPGFFTARDAQALTVARLQRQSVPILLLESGAEYKNFRESFPLIVGYLDEHYHLAGTRLFDRRFALQLFARNDRPPSGEYQPFGWPCFR